MDALRQPYVALLGVGGTLLAIVMCMLLGSHDPKLAITLAIGLGIAQLTKAAVSFVQGAPNAGIILFICFAVAACFALYIVGVNNALEAMKENGLAQTLLPAIGLYAVLLGAAQDRPRD